MPQGPEVSSGKRSCCKVTTIPSQALTPAITPGNQVTVQPDDVQTAIRFWGRVLSPPAPAAWNVCLGCRAAIVPSSLPHFFFHI